MAATAAPEPCGSPRRRRGRRAARLEQGFRPSRARETIGWMSLARVEDLLDFMDVEAAGPAVNLDGVAISRGFPSGAGQPHVAADRAETLTVKFEAIGAASHLYLGGHVGRSHNLHSHEPANDSNGHRAARSAERDVHLAG